MNLKEQAYTNLKRKYYYGCISRQNFDKPKPTKGLLSTHDELPLLFLTTNVLYAFDYAGWDPNKPKDIQLGSKIYICNLNKTAYIFNANCSDIKRLRRSWFLNYNEDILEDDLLQILIGDWVYTQKRDKFTKIVKHLNFDGFFNWENGEKYAPSIGLFSNDIINVNEIVYLKDFEKKFALQIEKGNQRAIKGLIEKRELSKNRAKFLHISENMLEYNFRLFYEDIE
jgi:hypothetical protein